MVGDKLLSVRAFSQQHRVSVTTALNCYGFLQDCGYANTRPKSGYFAQSPAVQVPDTPLVQFSSSPGVAPVLALQHTRHPFSTAQVSDALLPVSQLTSTMQSVVRAYQGELLSYGDARGSAQLRTTLAAWYAQKGFAFSSDEVVLGHGCIDSVRMALEVCTSPGDTVVVASPCYTGLLDVLRVLDRQILEIPSHSEGIDLEQLEAMIKQEKASALLVTGNYQNPLGHCFSNQHKQALAELANRYHFPIIEDDVYQELSFDGVLPLPIKYWDQEGLVLWCSSFSKTLCAGYRVGWCLPGKYQTAFAERRRIESLGINLPAQLVLAKFIATGGYRKHLRKLTFALHHQIRDYRERLALGLEGHIAISQPAGGLVLWCHVKGLDSEKLSLILQERGIGIRPGTLFSTRDFYQEYFRLNCGWPLNTDLSGQLAEVIICIRQLIGLPE